MECTLCIIQLHRHTRIFRESLPHGSPTRLEEGNVGSGADVSGARSAATLKVHATVGSCVGFRTQDRGLSAHAGTLRPKRSPSGKSGRLDAGRLLRLLLRRLRGLRVKVWM